MRANYFHFILFLLLWTVVGSEIASIAPLSGPDLQLYHEYRNKLDKGIIDKGMSIEEYKLLKKFAAQKTSTGQAISTTTTETTTVPQTTTLPSSTTVEALETTKTSIEQTTTTQHLATTDTTTLKILEQLPAFENSSECPITPSLYKFYMRMPGVDLERKMKNCTKPGCFFLFDQPRLGWKMPAYLASDLSAKHKYLSGCRYDIPFLLERTSNNERVHSALRALRACFVGKAKLPEQSFFCQPEYRGEVGRQQKENNNKKKKKKFETSRESVERNEFDGQRREDKINAWAEQFLLGTQDQCFLEFLEGVFFVEHEGNKNVVCCSIGNENIQKFKENCKSLTRYIDDGAWRAQVNV